MVFSTHKGKQNTYLHLCIRKKSFKTGYQCSYFKDPNSTPVVVITYTRQNPEEHVVNSRVAYCRNRYLQYGEI